jgi:hypothetical protein
MKPFEIASQLLKTICWRHSQIVEPSRGIDQFEFPLGGTSDTLEGTNIPVFKQITRAAVAKRLNHAKLCRIPVRGLPLRMETSAFGLVPLGSSPLFN